MKKVILIIACLQFQISYTQSFLNNQPKETPKHYFRKKIVEIDANSQYLDSQGVVILKLVSKLENGKTRRTGFGDWNALRWKNFEIKSTLAKSYSDGKILINKNILSSDNNEIEIKITPYNNPSYTKTIKVSLPYIQKVDISLLSKGCFTPKSKIPLDIIYNYSNGKKVDWYDMSKENKKMLSIKMNDKIINVNNLLMPNFQNEFSPKVTLWPILSNGKIIGDSLDVFYETSKDVVLYKNGDNGRNGRDALHNSYRKTSGNGKDGADGNDGENGEIGQNGADVEVQIEKDNSDQKLLKFTVYDNISGQTEIIYLNENYPRLFINCKGGSGGMGGNGGEGSYGRNGNTPNETGIGGNGGRGGNGGDGGKGGKVTIIVSEENRKYAEKVIVNNDGGEPGVGDKGGSRGRGGNAQKQDTFSAFMSMLGANSGTSGYDGVVGRKGFKGERTVIKIKP